MFTEVAYVSPFQIQWKANKSLFPVVALESLSKLEFKTRIREKMDMINERKRQLRHDLDPQERAHELQQCRILERGKQSSMTIHEREAFLKGFNFL
ncbi:hypothetical protein MKX03_012965 [Papaver bracteatum]|nr:hypothetical protein MKX03_012965 [Papaver bracteatum]